MRTILAFKLKDKAFFLYGFAKNQHENIDDKELKALKLMAKHFLAYDSKALEKAKKAQELIEVHGVSKVQKGAKHEEKR